MFAPLYLCQHGLSMGKGQGLHYIFMMIIYLFCQVNPIRMPASYPDSKQG